MSIFKSALSVNITTQIIEGLCKKILDIELSDKHKSILNFFLSTIIFRDGVILISSQAIHQIDKIIKKYNEKVSFVSILLGYNCISNIDKYGTITIPLAYILNKLTVKREIIGKTNDKYLNKKVLSNATNTLCISSMLKAIGIPNIISIPIINVLVEFCNTDIKSEEKIMFNSCVGFKGYRMSEVKKVLWKMEVEKIILSTMILILVTELGFKLGSSLILINVLEELINIGKSEYKQNIKKHSKIS